MRGVRKALAVGQAPTGEDLEMPAITGIDPAVPGHGSAQRPPALGSRRLLLVRLALAAGLTVLVVALAIVLTRPPLIVAGSNGVKANLAVTFIRHAEGSCESGGTVPEGTRAIRVSLSANTGPKVILKVFSGRTLVTEGEHDAGWGIDETVTLPVKRVPRTIVNARICTSVGALPEPLQVNGTQVRTTSGAIVTLLRMEYLRPGEHSWLSLAGSVARNMGLDHAPSGAWGSYLVIAIMLLVSIIASRLVLREAGLRAQAKRRIRLPTWRGLRPLRRLLLALRPVRRPLRALRRVPRAAWTCALIATLSAACWSLITPPFQAPDEPSHFAYAQLLAETGRLPDSSSGAVSQDEVTVMKALHQYEIQWHSQVPTFTSPTAQSELHEALSLPLNRVGPGAAGVAASEPPLYYAVASIPYDLGAGGTLLDQLELMRLLSALLAGLTALFVFLFVREALPGVPWAWTVGGLGAAITPLLGFTSGAVTPEAMLYTVSAAMFFCLARAFRRGLTRKRALALGAITAVGFLTKLNFIGLVPGVMLGLVILAFRGERVGAGAARSRRRAFVSMALAMALAATPVCAYVLSNIVNHHHLLGIISSTSRESPPHESIFADLAFIWQFYLPALPGMTVYFHGLDTTRQLWFDRAVGLYGWLDTSFPIWADNLALIPAGLIAALGLSGLFARRSRLRSRLPEILVYVTMSAGLMALIGQDLYVHQNIEGTGWAQPRYLVPLLPLLAAALALAARGAGRRLGPAVGVLIVVVFLAQDIFGQLLTVSRFYI
jgi:hypothetical protein